MQVIKAQAPSVIDEEHWSDKAPRTTPYPELGRSFRRGNSLVPLRLKPLRPAGTPKSLHPCRSA